MWRALNNQPRVVPIAIDGGSNLGALELWRHAFSLGGINPAPLPPHVISAMRRLKPRLIRIFIQEFFTIYPDHDRFDWTNLDAYMDALQQTGANVVAAITVKPPVLFPVIDHALWRPNNIDEWRRVIHALVDRYSVQKPIVTHWEVGNETDIGESGGSPYLIPTAKEYARFYRMTIEAILAAYPNAKVGGPASCWIDNEPLPGLIQECARTGTQLDFISWHLYSNDPHRHAFGVNRAKELLRDFPGQRPEMMITEWAKGFETSRDAGAATGDHPLSVDDLAMDLSVAALTAASVIEMDDADVDWTFHYHIWDQPCNPDDFRSFFSAEGTRFMVRWWNEFPQRSGLFGVNDEVRPHYFTFALLNLLGNTRRSAVSNEPNLHVLVGSTDNNISTMIANLKNPSDGSTVLELRHTNVRAGKKLLSVYRVDQGQPPPRDGQLHPVERRLVYTDTTFHCQVVSPGDSVTVVRIEDQG